jgi:hypothetical protein
MGLLFKVLKTIPSQEIRLLTIPEESILATLMATHSQATLFKTIAYTVFISALEATGTLFTTTTSTTPI